MQYKSREISQQNQVSADADEVQGDISEQNQVSADAVQVSADAVQVQGDISEQNQVSADADEFQGDISEQNQVSADAVQVNLRLKVAAVRLTRCEVGKSAKTVTPTPKNKRKWKEIATSSKGTSKRCKVSGT